MSDKDDDFEFDSEWMEAVQEEFTEEQQEQLMKAIKEMVDAGRNTMSVEDLTEDEREHLQEAFDELGIDIDDAENITMTVMVMDEDGNMRPYGEDDDDGPSVPPGTTVH